MSATLTSADPYVTIRWNTSSLYPDLAAGASADNSADWDLVLADEVPLAGYTARLGLQVTAANGGPWDLEVALPVSCAAPLEGALAAPGDVDGDGTGDAAVAYARDGEAPVLKVYSGATGRGAGHRPPGAGGLYPLVAAAAVPNFAALGGERGGRAAHRRRPPGAGGRGRCRPGRRLSSFGLSRAAAYLEIAVVPGAAGASPTLAILAQNADGTVRALRRDAATGARRGQVGFGTRAHPGRPRRAAGGDAGARLVLVGNDAAGALFAVARRAADGRLAARLRLSPISSPATPWQRPPPAAIPCW